MEAVFTPEELAAAKAYAAPIYAWVAVSDLVALATFAVILRFGVTPMFAASSRLAERCSRAFGPLASVPVARTVRPLLERLWGGRGYGTAVVFAVLLVLVTRAVDLPRAIYFGYLHPRAHGLSNDTPLSFFGDSIKSLVLSAVSMGLLAVGLYGLARRFRFWWLIVGVPAGLALWISTAFDHQRARVYFEQAPLEYGELRGRISALMAQANLPFTDVLVERTSRKSKLANAYFAGVGPSRAIVLNDVLVSELDTDEVVAAVAHEAGHAADDPTVRLMLSALVLILCLFATDQLFRLAARRKWFGVESRADIRTLPLLGLGLYLAISIAQPFAGAQSRQRELHADAYAVRLTRSPDVVRRMLVKVAKLNKADPDPPRWVVLRTFRHPPLAERLRHIDALAP